MLDGFCGQDAICGWAYVAHIIQRSLIHFMSGGSVLIAAVVGLTELERRGWLWEMRSLSLVATAALLSLLIIGQREAYDVAAGDSPIKSTIDGLTWAAGEVAAAVGLYRARDWINAAASQWLEWRKRT